MLKKIFLILVFLTALEILIMLVYNRGFLPDLISSGLLQPKEKTGIPQQNQETDDYSARRMMYDSPGQSDYTGTGYHYRTRPAKYLLIPKVTGRPFYINPSEKAKYSADDYEIMNYGGDEIMGYFAGFFDSFSDYPEPGVRKIILTVPDEKNKQENHEFLVSAEKTGNIPPEQITAISVEDTSLIENEVRHAPQTYRGMDSLSAEELSVILKKGDAVVVLPFIDGITLVPKKDKDGLFYASHLVLRRSKGLEALKQIKD